MTGSQPRGLIAALITPLGNKEELDGESLAKLLNTVTEHSDALLVAGNHAGEGALLPRETRETLIRETMRIVAGRTTLLIGITANTVEETFENAKCVEGLRNELNYNGTVFLFDCPLWYRSNRGLPTHCEELMTVTSLPLILSNNPALISNLKTPLKRYNIRTGVLRKLLSSNRIAGLAHSGDLHRSLNYVQAARSRQDFHFYDGSELNFLNNPSTDGVVSIGANVLPEEWEEVVGSSLDTDDSRKENADYRGHIWDLMEKLRKLHASYEDNPPALVKAALKHKGIIASDSVTGKSIEATEEEKKRIYDMLRSK
jgi:4-hydroxy-tetrahydrodipicolinate synthase